MKEKLEATANTINQIIDDLEIVLGNRRLAIEFCLSYMAGQFEGLTHELALDFVAALPKR